jgi:hypothetical protein
MLENTERAMKKEQFRETGNRRYTLETQGTEDEEKQNKLQHNMC